MGVNSVAADEWASENVSSSNTLALPTAVIVYGIVDLDANDLVNWYGSESFRIPAEIRTPRFLF